MIGGWISGEITMKAFTIELRVHHQDPEKDTIIRDAMRVAAKHVYTTALLIADSNRKPQIALSSSDFFEAAEEISLADDIPTDED
jgi:hypothetical protein